MYEKYSKYYDRLNSHNEYWVPILDQFLGEYPDQSSLIEYGCGTGKILECYQSRFKLTGVDISESMLQIASLKLPSSDFHLSDMAEFKSPDRFDISLCLFDSLNHILDFSRWKLFISQVVINMKPSGILIIDINTTKRLELISSRQPLFQEFDTNYFYMNVNRRSESNFVFDVRILESIGDGCYKEFREEIEEVTTSGESFYEELEQFFSEITLVNERKEFFTKDEFESNEQYRIFFICRGK